MVNIDFDELSRIMAPFADENDEQGKNSNQQVDQVERVNQVMTQGAASSKKDEEIITYGGYQFWLDLWKFIDALRVIQQGRDQKYLQWQAWKRPKGKRNKYVDVDRRILGIIQDYERRRTEEYLKGIANNFEMED